MKELPIAKTTEMFTVRDADGRHVMTYQDLSEGFQVDAARIRQGFSRNSEAWPQEETGVYQFDTGEEIRYFTPRGAMRFCRYIKSGRSDQLYNHLLDLWEEERNGRAIAPRDPISEVDRLATSLLPVVHTVAVMDTRLSAVEERQKQIDPQEIERRMTFLNDCKNLIVNGTKGKPQAVTHPKFWQELKKLIGINSFTNRAALTVEMMDRCVAYAKEWCETRGVNPPSLFDSEVAA